MFSERVLSTLTILVVVLLTAGFFVSAEPEDLQIASDDGAVTVTGLARQTQPFEIRTGAAVIGPLLGSSYHVSPDTVTLDEPVVIAFHVPDTQVERAERLGVYRLHPDIHMWELVTPVVSHTDEILAIETAQLGDFALGEVTLLAAPVFANVYDELRSMAPANAVGYETAVGYTGENRELIRLLSVGEMGGCNGTVRVGDTEALSQLERNASVMLGDQQQTVTFVFVTRWFTSSTGGCVAGEVLKPLGEYDILK